MAVLLGQSGVACVLVARRGDRLQEIADRYSNFEVLEADLTTDAGCAKVVARIADEQRPIDLVVNNAGFGSSGWFHEIESARLDDEIALNIRALTRVSRAAIEVMVGRKRGWLMNVSSVASFQPAPKLAVYAATKAYVNSFSDGLRMELRDTGITVTAVLPGPVETEFGRVASRGTGEPEWSSPDELLVSVEEVVRQALVAVAADKARVIPGWKVALFMGLAVALPLGVLRAILQRQVR